MILYLICKPSTQKKVFPDLCKYVRSAKILVSFIFERPTQEVNKCVPQCI